MARSVARVECAVVPSSPHLFSGLLKCSQCGANISIVSGRWRGRRDVVYGCPQNTYRGEPSTKTIRGHLGSRLKRNYFTVFRSRSCDRRSSNEQMRLRKNELDRESDERDRSGGFFP